MQVETVPGLAAIPPCEETGATFEENAILKAQYYGPLAPGLLFADDSGLEVDALGGAPGVYSARFAGPDATDEANNRLLLERMRGVRDRSARFVCVIALVDGARVLGTFRGVVEGEILEEAARARTASATIRCFSIRPSAARSARPRRSENCRSAIVARRCGPCGTRRHAWAIRSV